MSDDTKAYQDALYFNGDDNISFESLYIPQSNELAINTTKKLIDRKMHECIFLFGPEGCGKTHLITALFNNIENRGAEAFFIDMSIVAELSPELLKVDPYNVMFLDNIDAVCGKKEYEDALFALYNRWLDYGRGPLIATAVKSSDKIDFLRRDLNTRFGHGYKFPLESLNDEDCAKALELKAQLRGFTLSSKVTQYIVRHRNAYMPSLVKVLDRLDRASLQQKREITIPFIKQILTENTD